MKKIKIHINYVPYTITCDERDFERVEHLGYLFNEHVTRVGQSIKRGDQAHLFLVTALLILEELESLKKKHSLARYEQRINELSQKVKTISEMCV